PSGCVPLGGGARRAVFVVPGGAGDGPDLFAARRIARATGGGFAFLAFRSSAASLGPGSSVAEAFLRQLREAQPAGPYALVGDCVGGSVAFAMARRLRAAGESVDVLALVDAPFPGGGRRRRAWLRRHAPAASRLLERLAYFGGRLRHHAAVLREARSGRAAYAARFGRVGLRGLSAPSDPRRERFLDRRSTYVAAALAERPGVYDGAVLLVESEATTRRGDGAAWDRLAARVDRVVVPGDHARLLLDHDGPVGEALRRALEGAAQAEADGEPGGSPHFSSNFRRFSS
ncbi:MAG: thioesterase domain-containing protein, partial [Syntrophomonadaceae bacterium]